MSENIIKEIAGALYRKEQKAMREKACKEEKNLSEMRLKETIREELEKLRTSGEQNPESQLETLKKKYNSLGFESKKIEKIILSLENQLKPVRQELSIVYEKRYQSEVKFIEAQKQDDLEKKESASLELQVVRENAGVIWSKEKELEKKIDEMKNQQKEILEQMNKTLAERRNLERHERDLNEKMRRLGLC